MDDDERGYQIQQQQQQQQQSRRTILDIESLETMAQQERDINQMGTIINEVHSLFDDLGEALENQAQKVDSIEGNFENADHIVSEGARQIHQAAAYQTRLRRRRFICMSVLASLCAIFIFYIFWSFRN